MSYKLMFYVYSVGILNENTSWGFECFLFETTQRILILVKIL